METIDKIIPIFFILFIGLILFWKATIVISQRWRVKKLQEILLQQNMRSNTRITPFILDLRTCNEGMSCDEYSTLIIAGLDSEDIPPTVRSQMNQHENACSYHQSETWHQSALGTPVTETLEEEAMEIVKKYSQE